MEKKKWVCVELQFVVLKGVMALTLKWRVMPPPVMREDSGTRIFPSNGFGVGTRVSQGRGIHISLSIFAYQIEKDLNLL